MELGEGKWENLPKDCLVAILGGVGIGSLLYDVPFVCKSWYHASLDPSCWRILDFTELMSRRRKTYRPTERACTIIKTVVDRSHKSATKFVLPNNYCSPVAKILEYISNECPDLKFLSTPLLDKDLEKILLKLIVKWKSLEILHVHRISRVVKILTQIQLHCKNFVGFLCLGCDFGPAEALSISSSGIKYLGILDSVMGRDVVEMIIVNCKNLELLDVRDCLGFEGDSDLLNLGSHINSFLCEGSVSYSQDYPYHFDPFLGTLLYGRDINDEGSASD